MVDPVLKLSVILLGAVAILVYVNWRYHYGPLRYLIRLGKQSRWQTRPTLLRTEHDLTVAREVAALIEGAGLGHVKVAMFLGKPTMDLVLDPTASSVTPDQIEILLAGREAQVETLRGGFRPMRYK